jgi:DNA-binding transcriptional ArsR family regulator
MIQNMKKSTHEQISEIFEAIRSPVRIQILYAIGREEVCVCHLEALLGLRQARISQHLMDLREKGILAFRREGKFSYYRLNKPEILDLMHAAARMADVTDTKLLGAKTSGCDCPRCAQVTIK